MSILGFISLFSSILVNIIANALTNVIVSSLASNAEEVKITRQDVNRAEYYYNEALRQHALGNNDNYYFLLKRAAEIDPSEVAYGQDLGFYMVALADRDSMMITEGLARMKMNVDRYPAQIYDGIAYYTLLQSVGYSGEALRVMERLDSIYPDKMEVAVRYAEALGRTSGEENLHKAVGIYDRLEKEYGKSLSLTMPKVGLRIQLSDTVGAAGELKSLIADNPSDAEPITILGDLNMSLQRPDSAIYYYNLACEADSASGLACYKRAAFYHQQGDTARYEKEIIEAIDKDNLDTEVRLELLRTLVVDMLPDSTRHGEIENIFNRLIEKMPHESQLRKMYVGYFLAINDYERAAEQQAFVPDIDPDDETVWLQLISLYGSANDTEGQKRAMKQALELFPESEQLRMYDAQLLFIEGDYDKALEEGLLARRLMEDKDDSEQGVGYDKLKSNIEMLLGDIYYKKEAPDTAFCYYESALKLDPDNAMAMNNYAYFLALDGRELDKAESLSVRSVALNPENSSNRDTYAWVLFKKGEYERAKAEIDKAMEIAGDETSAELFEHAGDIYFFNKLPDEAVAFWEKALKLDSENSLLKKKVKNKTYYYE